jgi:hypothetical protein
MVPAQDLALRSFHAAAVVASMQISMWFEYGL